MSRSEARCRLAARRRSRLLALAGSSSAIRAPRQQASTIAPQLRRLATRSGETRPAAANDFAKLILPVFDGEMAGLSANAAAAELNRRGVQTARGDGKWTARTVMNALAIGKA